MKTITGIWKLARPFNCAIAAATVLFCGWVVEQSFANAKLWIAAVVVVLITAGANTMNDYFDLTADRVNRPTRPLPSGQVSPGTALAIALTEMSSGVLLSKLLGNTAMGIALLATVLLILYTPFFKPLPLIGNVMVAGISAITFVFAGVVLGQVEPLLFPALVAFFFHLGRELLKDVQDFSGDHSSGYRTFPLVVGMQSAVRVVQGVFGVLILILFLPLVWRGYNMWYYILVIGGVLPAVAFAFRVVQQSPEDFSRMERASVILKWTMVYGLLSIAVGVVS